MSHYKHLTLSERECIMCLLVQGYSISEIAKQLNRNKSTISREIHRNANRSYFAAEAEHKYHLRRRLCRPHRILEDPKKLELVKSLFLDHQWSPEQISGRLKHENGLRISYKTIYREIYAGTFNPPGLSHGNRGAIRKLRHHGKTRHVAGYVEKRGKIVISNPIEIRPDAANNRERLGDWEADTVICKKDCACLVTLADRKSRFLISKKVSSKSSECVTKAMIHCLRNEPLHSITPDRGKEFAKHKEVTETLNVPFYFPLPHHPWQRGTNENTNGLLREYFPKSRDITNISDEYIQSKVDELNKRPRKCLGYMTPYEVYYSKTLHLV